MNKPERLADKYIRAVVNYIIPNEGIEATTHGFMCAVIVTAPTLPVNWEKQFDVMLQKTTRAKFFPIVSLSQWRIAGGKMFLYFWV